MATITSPSGVGLALLRTLPIITTTATLTYALAELTLFCSLTVEYVLPPLPDVESNYRTNYPEEYEKDIVLSNEQAKAMRRVLPMFFTTYSESRKGAVLVFNVANWLALSVNLWGSGLPTTSRTWLKFGLVASLAHLAIGSLVAIPAKRLCDFGWLNVRDAEAGQLEEEERKGRGPVEELDRWLALQSLRMMFADLPAWLCCVVGYVTSVSL